MDFHVSENSIYTDSASGQNSDAEFAISVAKEVTGIGNVDLMAQKRALTLYKLEQLKNESVQMKVIYNIYEIYNRVGAIIIYMNVSQYLAKIVHKISIYLPCCLELSLLF